MKRIPLGSDSYEAVCQNCYYVDKTSIIAALADLPEGTSYLFTRPRRFGKSLMLSMLQAFFEESEKDKTSLFEDKKIFKDKPLMETHFQRYPVLHLNLKNAIASNYDGMIQKIKEAISFEYERHASLLKSKKLSAKDKAYFESIRNEVASDLDYSSSLLKLTGFMEKASGKKAIVLIDEYDAPAHYAYQNGFYEPAILFLKQLFSSVLKSNDSLHLALLTGVLQIAKESLFSGLNNLITNSVLSVNMDEGFGFSEEETKDLLDYYGCPKELDKVREWYGNYHFGNAVVYNPLSVLSFLQNGKSHATYWNNTADNSVLGSIIEGMSESDSLLPLISGQAVSSPIDIALSYKDLSSTSENILSFLLASGYLTVQEKLSDFFYSLVFPNREIESVFQREIALRYVPKNDFPALLSMKSSFEKGVTAALKRDLEKYLLSSFSCYEIGQEKSYQVMLSTALSLIFESCIVRNEVNAGTGRADILVYSLKEGKPAFVIETKALRSNASLSRIKNSAIKAIEQIKEKDYLGEIKPHSPSLVTLYGIAFYKKRVHIEQEQITF